VTTLLEDLVPSEVSIAETRLDVLDITLFPEEEACLGNAVDKRRREFVTGRACARTALDRLGLAPCAIPSGERGQPLWPAGVVGSITHCPGYRACAVAWAADVASIGIDAEVHAPLPDRVLQLVSSTRERQILTASPLDVHLDRLLFSAKEAVYKAWFPLARTRLGYEDVELCLVTEDASFRARLLVPGPAVDGVPLTSFSGRWSVAGDLVLTAVAVSPFQTEPSERKAPR
jgi:4'-phosphopantetheinyl transferase EntD